MNFKKYFMRKKNIKKKYSVKEALALYIYAKDSVENLKYDEIIKRLENLLLNTNDNREIMDGLNDQYNLKIKNYWSLSYEQVMAYGKKIFDGLIVLELELNDENIFKEFMILMRLYSPDNMEDFYKNKFGGY